jgi:hydroxymethylpyrimidine pyrophosphatase-like HAD family hydrolase
VKPLAQLPAGGIEAVLFDIDETLTTSGKLTAQAYAALEALQQAGLRVVPVTGRPAGWCDHIARMWPVDAVVGENGAFYFWFAGGKLGKRFVDDAATRARNRARLATIGEDILRDERVAERMRAEGLTAKVSSIHVNGWFGAYDKLATARKLFAERFHLDLDRSNGKLVFVGDSPNDAPMFAFFDHAVGVANVRRFAGLQPKFITGGESGAGFAELVTHLLKSK